MRYADELQYSVYNRELADASQRSGSSSRFTRLKPVDFWTSYKDYAEKRRFPLLAAYDHVLKCSNLFNTLDGAWRGSA